MAGENFNVLVTKLDALAASLEKLEKRIDGDHADIFERVRKLEIENAVMKTKVLTWGSVLTFVISAVVSIAASLIVFWLRAPGPPGAP